MSRIIEQEKKRVQSILESFHNTDNYESFLGAYCLITSRMKRLIGGKLDPDLVVKIGKNFCAPVRLCKALGESSIQNNNFGARTLDSEDNNNGLLQHGCTRGPGRYSGKNKPANQH